MARSKQSPAKKSPRKTGRKTPKSRFTLLTKEQKKWRLNPISTKRLARRAKVLRMTEFINDDVSEQLDLFLGDVMKNVFLAAKEDGKKIITVRHVIDSMKIASMRSIL